MKFIMDDSERNKIVLRIASKIQQDGTPHDEQNPTIMEQYIKYAISFNIPKSKLQKVLY